MFSDRTRSVAVATRSRAAWYPWALVGMLFLLMFINFADRSVLGLAAVPMMEEMRLSPVQWGTVGSSFYYLFSISIVVFGFVADRVPAKLVLALLASIWAITQFPMVGAVSLPVLIASRVALGAGEGPAFTVALHAAYKWFPSDKRALPTAVIAIGASIGITIATPILVDVIYAYSWHVAFGLLGVLGALWVAVWLIFAEEGDVSLGPILLKNSARRSGSQYLIVHPVEGASMIQFGCPDWIIVAQKPLRTIR